MIKVEFEDLGPHNGMCEPDADGSYRAFALTERGDPVSGDPPQRVVFLAPSHQLPTDHAPVSVPEAAKLLLGDFNSPMLTALDPFNNDADVAQDVLPALRALSEGEG